MAVTTSAAIIAAARDVDLRERAVALAAKLGVANPSYWVDSHLYELAGAQVDSTGENTVASVFEYAQGRYEQAMKNLVAPGKNLAAVTDKHLEHVITKIWVSSSER